MTNTYSLTGFSFFDTSSGASDAVGATLDLLGTEDLEFSFISPEPEAGSITTGTLSVEQGSLFQSSLNEAPIDIESVFFDVSFQNVVFEGQTSQVMILENVFSGQKSVFGLSGAELNGGNLMTGAQLDTICDDNTSDITTGPFAIGTAFSPSAISGVVTAPYELVATAEADFLFGLPTDEQIDGLAGNDGIDGNAGNDRLSGGAGNDEVNGGAGLDTISGEAGIDELSGGGGMDTFIDSAANFDGDTINDLDYGDEITITGLTNASEVTVSGSTVSIDTNGDGAENHSFTVLTDFFSFAPQLNISDTGGTRTLSLDTTGVAGAGIGEQVEGASDFDRIGDFLFSDPAFVPQSISYTGAYESIALLDEGFTISDISGDTPVPVVSIDRGVFISSGGGPGTQNTQDGFSVALQEPGNDLLDDAARDAFSGAGETNDASIISFTFDAVDLGDAPSISFDVLFGSDEFPEFVDSDFVDIATIFVNGVNYALFNGDAEQPLSIIGESINTEGNFFANDGAAGTYDTEYDGFSVLLNVIAPVQEGLNEVVIAIADTGDSILDSGLFVGNVAASNLNVSGSFIETNGTDASDLINANAAPELTTLGGGQDTVSGTAAELDGDLIDGFGDDDTLAFEGVTFGAEDLQITLGSAILDIDTDDDGTADTQVTLQGDFRNAGFAVNTADGNTVVTATGVDTDGATGQVIVGTDGNDTLTGGSGDDTVSGGTGDDLISGSAGDDLLAGALGNDVVNGGTGNDNMGGGLGDDTMDGGIGDDLMGAGFGDDSMDGGTGNDGVFGGAGDDTVNGGEGDDNMAGSFGSDVLSGGTGDDNMGGGTGKDTVSGGSGDDTIGGGEGDDRINGGGGDDFLAGGGRADTINGGNGDDRINAGAGDDLITGGAGGDIFIFTQFNDGETDTITDWTNGEDIFRVSASAVDTPAGSGSQGILDALNGSQSGSDVQFSYEGHTITVQNASLDEIGLEDFLFV